MPLEWQKREAAISMISQDEQRDENSTGCSLSRSSSKDSALPRDSIQSPTLADQMVRWSIGMRGALLRYSQVVLKTHTCQMRVVVKVKRSTS